MLRIIIKINTSIDRNTHMATRPRSYKTFLMLNSTEHEISTPIKAKLLKNQDFSCFQTLNVVIIMLINAKMPTIVCILTFMSMINFVFS